MLESRKTPSVITGLLIGVILVVTRAFTAPPTMARSRAPQSAVARAPPPATMASLTRSMRDGSAALRATDAALAADDASAAPLEVSPASDLWRGGRHITVVTTASLPWMTGTAVNPTLRAAHLAASGKFASVTLLVPWLEPHDQETVFGNGGVTFATRDEQTAFVRGWMADLTPLPVGAAAAEGVTIAWYDARWAPGVGSILPCNDDLIGRVPAARRDVAVLEEPEHLNWCVTAVNSSWRFS